MVPKDINGGPGVAYSGHDDWANLGYAISERRSRAGTRSPGRARKSLAA
jgi:hypothetical protein